MTTNWQQLTAELATLLQELPTASYVTIEPRQAPDTGWVQFKSEHDVPDLTLQCRKNEDHEQAQQRTADGWTLEEPMWWERHVTWPATMATCTENAQALVRVLQETATSPDDLIYQAWREPHASHDATANTPRYVTDPEELETVLTELTIPRTAN